MISMKILRKKAKWNWVITILWAYTLLFLGFGFISNFFFSSYFNSLPIQKSLYNITGGLMILPMIIFLLVIGINNFRNDE